MILDSYPGVPPVSAPAGHKKRLLRVFLILLFLLGNYASSYLSFLTMIFPISLVIKILPWYIVGLPQY